MNKIHIAIAAAWIGLATLMVATATNAKDFSIAGQTLSIGAETDLNYTCLLYTSPSPRDS